MHASHAAIVVVMLMACSFGESMGTADKAVAEFHARYNARDFHRMYADADARFKQTTTESKWTKFPEELRSNLGTY